MIGSYGRLLVMGSMEEQNGSNKRKLKAHPQERSNILSALFHWWTIPIFRIGLKKDISEEDIYQTLQHHQAEGLANRLEKAWKSQLKNPDPSLWKAMLKVFKLDTIVCLSFFSFINLILKITHPVAFGKLMAYYSFASTESSKYDAIFYASIIVIVSVTDSVLTNYYVLQHMQAFMKFRVACSSLIYRKSLRLSKSALGETNVGQIVNLLTNDMQQINLSLRAVCTICVSPFQTVIVLYLLYDYCGPTALVGVVLLVVLTPFQMYISKIIAGLRSKVAVRTDDRMSHMNEIISGIQVIKLYGWEQPFIKMIDTFRRVEVKFIRKLSYLNSFLVSLMKFVERTVIFLCILVYVLTGNNPNAHYVYVVTSFYSILVISVSVLLPLAVSDLLKANVSIKRFEKFLKLEEVELIKKTQEAVGIKVKKVTAKWVQSYEHNTLSDVDFEIYRNQTVAIVGPTGSGKSSLLHLCLGEIPIIKGSIEIGGTIAYANQEPWLFGGTVKQNILFGLPMLPKKYKEVVRVCALEDDMVQFPHGDNTIVGERGILLSGGQKARIGLARAVYKDADIYLLDDPLSAVDANVGKQIFNNCIIGYLKGKCTILVTHQTQYLASVDKIYLLTDGKISVSGSYTDLLKENNFAYALKENETHQDEASEMTGTDLSKLEHKEQNVTSETRAVGKVSITVYQSYMRACGSYWICLLTLVPFVLCECFGTGADYFIAFWVNLEQRRLSDNNTLQNKFEEMSFTNNNSMYIYSAIIVILVVMILARSISFIRVCMHASIYLHDKMFTTIINTTMKFFHTNVSGRILNRFSKDIGNIDGELPIVLFNTLELSIAVIGAIISVCIISPWSLIPTFVILILMYIIRRTYLASSLNLKRLESTSRSPIFAHLTESVKGLTTIRAFDIRHILHKEFENLQNFHTSIFYMTLGTNRAFSIGLDFVCVCYSSVVTIMTIFQETSGGTVGFVITKSMSLVGVFQWAIRTLSELENQMTSVERVVEYTELGQEQDHKVKTLSSVWFPSGKIEFKSVFMQYSSNDPYVLKNLNILIKPKEKIGIVGRTGAGKSSLVSVLFRLVNFEGDIFIDDVNTKDVALSSLRPKISIIPQDPVLFAGSVRKNLDPFEQYSDEEIWRVLDEVKLKEAVSNMSGNLHSNLSEGGTNFSVGQKQLICLARAMLKNNNILILDEATANVDPQTDELLQSTIRKSFANCTVLTIAHRLHTIMDSDKVLVMDEGYAVEFDHPHVLLENQKTFYNLVMKTGNVMSENLTTIAEKNYKTRGDNIIL
ncbi:probable multidrug resistance-associated protein lethal(2)03659 isoform X1 [Zophobas morio]|uniref:probable multidrug resistance-associated protein lethal(2)03659 isoform X1 n=2 Tax=Zophobas morio TaxID=2755281 RepID=UPI003082DEB5